MIHKILAWPLYSTKRLVLTVVAVVVVLVFGVRIVHPHHPTPVADAVAVVRGTATPSPSATVPSPSASPSPSQQAAASVRLPRDQATVAVKFVDAWASHQPGTAWLYGVRPYVTESLFQQLMKVDPDKVTALGVHGRPIATLVQPEGSEIIVPVTDHGGNHVGRVIVDTTRVGGHWLVFRFEQD